MATARRWRRSRSGCPRARSRGCCSCTAPSPTPLGSFGALAAQSAQWRRLEAAYRDRILALDHHTLSRSPIENAEEVLARLPEGAELHLVGYSRGGLIGELLCRGRLEGRDLPFDETELGLFDRRRSDRAARGSGTARRIPDRAAPGRSSRYVRVACPARGTTLASDRLDRWLNFVLNAVGLGIGAVASPLAGEIYDLVTAFLLAVIKERADASTIPGLEAMIPGAPLVRLLNRPGVTAATDLAVLEGDIEGAGILGRLKVLATDLFFREDHDLVVNTSAMDGGMARNPPARAFFTQGPEVSHFTYFGNPKTAERVVEGLLRADDQDGGFKPIPAERGRRRHGTRQARRREAAGRLRPARHHRHGARLHRQGPGTARSGSTCRSSRSAASVAWRSISRTSSPRSR